MILVTGGTGIVGSHLLLLLTAKKKTLLPLIVTEQKSKKFLIFLKKITGQNTLNLLYGSRPTSMILVL